MTLSDILNNAARSVKRHAYATAGLAGILLGAWMPNAHALNHRPNDATVNYTIPRAGSVAVPVTVTSDPDGDPLVWGGVNTSPQHGLLKRSADKSKYNYTPYSTYTGNDTFIIGVLDPSYDGALVTVNVSITYSNSPPQGTVGTRATPTEGQSGSWQNVLTNVVPGPDADAGQTTTITGITAADPSHFKNLEATLNPDNTVAVNATVADYVEGLPWAAEDDDGNPVNQTVKGTFRITLKDNAGTADGGQDTAVVEAPYTIGANPPDSFAMTPVEAAVATFAPDENNTRAESGWSAVYTLPTWPLSTTPMKQSGKLPREPAEDRAADPREAGDKGPSYKSTGTGPALMADVTAIDSAGNFIFNTPDPAEYEYAIPGHGMRINTLPDFTFALYDAKKGTLGPWQNPTPSLLAIAASQTYPDFSLKTKPAKGPNSKSKLTATAGAWSDPALEQCYSRPHEGTIETTTGHKLPFALQPAFDDGSGLLPLYAVSGHHAGAGLNDITHVTTGDRTYTLDDLTAPVPCGDTVRFGRREQANQPQKPDLEVTLDGSVNAGKTPVQGDTYLWKTRIDEKVRIYVGMKIGANDAIPGSSPAAVLPKAVKTYTHLTVKAIP